MPGLFLLLTPYPFGIMADHKAPTQVTIAPYQEASQLQQAVDRYWKPFVAIAVLIAAAILFFENQKSQSVAEQQAKWGVLNEKARLAEVTVGVELADPATIAEATSEVQGSSAEPWGRLVEIESMIQHEMWAEAEEALKRFDADFADHPLVKQAFPTGVEGQTATISESVRRAIAGQREFREQHANLFALPALPEGSPRVELDTSAGKIVIGLYAARAPQHVANFTKLVSNGYYDGVKFHRSVADFMIQTGDPNTKVGDPSTWGQGGPDYTIPQEFSDLYHFQGAVAMAKKPDEVESSGSQFYITTGSPHHLDGEHTVFGILLEGQEVVDRIENLPVEPGTDRPEEPAVINAARVLE